jgi:arylsulfatase A-like enzyme
MHVKNVVLLTIDALRRDALGCYGNPDGLTPFLDSLGERALRFTNVQAVGPYTQASFPGILTSSYYLDYPDHGKGKVLSAQRTLVSEPLRAAGRTTAAFHSNAYLCDVFGWNRGWHTFYDSMDEKVTDQVPYVRGAALNEKVDAWLAGQAGGDGRPFFLWVHYMDLHEPYVPEREYLDLVAPDVSLTEQEMFELFNEAILPRDASDPETVRLLRALYDAHVREIDDCVKGFFALLERHGLRDESVVLVTSDHGDEFGEHGGLSHDGKMVPELLDVPLLIADPDRPGPDTCDTPVSNVDIPPTIVHLFGLDPVDAFQGRSLLPTDEHPGGPCYAEATGKTGRPKPTDRPVYACRRDNLRVTWRAESDTWELYDLSADPGQTRDLIDTSPQAEAIKALLQARIDR